MTTTDELLPCPFCGGEATVRYEGHANVLSVGCRECNIRTAYMVADDIGMAEAITAWNRRAETVEPRTCRLTPDDHYRVDKITTSWGCVCSACGSFFKYTHGEGWAYCPSCGRRIVEVNR